MGTTPTRTSIASTRPAQLRRGTAGSMPSFVATSGTIRIVTPEVDAQTRLGLARITLSPGSGLKPGMFARADIAVGDQPATTVPTGAVLYRENKPGVFVLNGDGTVHFQPITVLSRTEAQTAVSGVNVGLFCATPGVALSRNVPRKAAFEMLVTGEFVSAEQARSLGLVNRVAAADALDDEIEALVASIVAKPRVAVAMGKALFYRQIEVDIESAYTDAGTTMACNMMDPSALEGVQAFIDKRSPTWSVAST